jgi:diacylglycerol kinase (ATP)
LAQGETDRRNNHTINAPLAVSMRIALVHNVIAGDQGYESDELAARFRSAGCVVETFGSRKKQIRRALESEPDVLVVAGGDGTVAKAAIRIRKLGSPVPMFVIPTGTANNIARSLGIRGSPDELARGLARARPATLDVGVVEGELGRRRFVEGAGVGFIGAMLERGGTVRDRVRRAAGRVLHPRMEVSERIARGVASLIRHQRASYRRVICDGEDLSGEYIAVEVMNTREIGPRVGLAPNADVGDGMLDLALVRSEDRERIAASVEGTGAGASPGMSRRASRVEIVWPESSGHVDDKPWPGPDETDDRQVRITVDGSIGILLPAQPQKK